MDSQVLPKRLCVWPSAGRGPCRARTAVWLYIGGVVVALGIDSALALRPPAQAAVIGKICELGHVQGWAAALSRGSSFAFCGPFERGSTKMPQKGAAAAFALRQRSAHEQQTCSRT